ncbi:MAG: hypothetical protein OXH75_15595 [Acidobacteria bacterium]|nr:hypothetical protein [Acidobacteriota bacterium]
MTNAAALSRLHGAIGAAADWRVRLHEALHSADGLRGSHRFAAERAHDDLERALFQNRVLVPGSDSRLGDRELDRLRKAIDKAFPAEKPPTKNVTPRPKELPE